jgi:hypothetical protein
MNILDGEYYNTNRQTMENSIKDKDNLADTIEGFTLYKNDKSPVFKKNVSESNNVKKIQNEYYKELNKYDDMVLNMVENMSKYNNNNNLLPIERTKWERMRDKISRKIKIQYDKLNRLLSQIKTELDTLNKTELELNEQLLEEYYILETNLKKYDSVYSKLHREKLMINYDTSLEEDGELNMKSYNQQYILWSILALGMTIGVVKIMK